MPIWGVFIWWKWWIYFCLISTFKGFFGFTLVCMLLSIFHSFYEKSLFSFPNSFPKNESRTRIKGSDERNEAATHFTKNAKVPVWTQELWKSLEIWNGKNQNGTLWDAFSWFFTKANVSQHLYEGTERVQSHAHGPLTLTFILAFPLTSTLFIMYLRHFLCREQKCSKWSLKLPVLCSYKPSVSEQE